MKKDIDAKCYELTLTPNYVSDWTFNDALRELIQNGTDQEVLDKENKFQIIYNGKEKTLRLVNQKSVLKINTLLLGRSSKANWQDENHCLYTWDDLDGKRPTMKEYQEQQDERYRNGKD